ncbi:MAG: hypothetical protein HY315_01900, partial [Acidobacteria bacterium]|nr:hypothetical protein [Acidobacteriota bacterium]
DRLAEAQRYLDAAKAKVAETGWGNQAELAHLHDSLAHLQWYGLQFTEAIASVHTRLSLSAKTGASNPPAGYETVALDTLLLGDWERTVDQEYRRLSDRGGVFDASGSHL